MKHEIACPLAYAAVVESELSGRAILASFPNVARKLREDGRVYIATAPDSVGRRLYGQGFIIDVRST